MPATQTWTARPALSAGNVLLLAATFALVSTNVVGEFYLITQAPSCFKQIIYVCKISYAVLEKQIPKIKWIPFAVIHTKSEWE